MFQFHHYFYMISIAIRKAFYYKKRLFFLFIHLLSYVNVYLQISIFLTVLCFI